MHFCDQSEEKKGIHGRRKRTKGNISYTIQEDQIDLIFEDY